VAWVRKLAAWLRRLHDRVEDEHYTILRMEERLNADQGLGVVEQLLDQVGPLKNSQVVLDTTHVWAYIRSLLVPIPGDACLDLPVSNVMVLDCHSISGEVAQAFYPSVLKARHAFYKQTHQRVGRVYKGEYVVKRLG
jgi:hypothetical protein